MGLISRVSSRTYRSEKNMFRSSRHLLKRVPLTFQPYEAPTSPNLSTINQLKFDDTLKLNPIDLTNEKIEKRTTWPRTYKLKIFNPDGSSYQIHHHEPKAVIQIPKDVSQRKDKMDYVRRVRMFREGSKVSNFVELNRTEDVL